MLDALLYDCWQIGYFVVENCHWIVDFFLCENCPTTKTLCGHHDCTRTCLTCHPCPTDFLFWSAPTSHSYWHGQTQVYASWKSDGWTHNWTLWWCNICQMPQSKHEVFPVCTTSFQIVHKTRTCTYRSCWSTAGVHEKQVYFLMIRDDYTCFVWIITLPRKDKVIPALTSFNNLCVTQYNRHIGYIQSDNRHGFVNKSFSDYCSAHSIQHLTTVPHHPQMSGAVEQLVGVIKEKICILLLQALLRFLVVVRHATWYLYL